MTLLDPQPPPTPGTGDVWLDVVEAMPGTPLMPRLPLMADMMARRAQGIARYNTPLQYGNGRDSYVDAYQEYLDGVAYLWAARAPWWLRWGAIFFAALVRRYATKENR